ncbi:MAG: nuclear transport factor 2 family protein [Cohaesibacter sp.]|nr:nuclear transport factor 2 family protein [Cohaesibacter sp.]
MQNNNIASLEIPTDDPWISALFEAIDCNCWDALEQILAPDVVYERPGYAPLVGRDAVMNFYRHIRIIKSGIHKVQGFARQGKILSYYGNFKGISQSDEPLNVDFCDICKLDGDHLYYRKTFFHIAAV